MSNFVKGSANIIINMRVKFTSIFPLHCHKSGIDRDLHRTLSADLDARRLGLFGRFGENLTPRRNFDIIFNEEIK